MKNAIPYRTQLGGNALVSRKTNDLPLLRVITQDHLERVEVVQELAQTALTPQLRQIMRSIEAGAPVQPGRRCVEYLLAPESTIHITQQPSAFRVAITNLHFHRFYEQEVEFHHRVLRDTDQKLRRVNHQASPTQAHNFQAQAQQYIDNCNYISHLRCQRSKARRLKDRCLLEIARFLLSASAKAFALLDMSSFNAGMVDATGNR